jgi:predicted dehydrogenase
VRFAGPGNKPRVGLIGTGRIAGTGHVPAYQKYGVEIAAVCSRNRADADACAASISGEPNVYVDALELASDPAVEILDVATRQHDRAELLRSLLKFNKPILSQKPLCSDLDEAEAIVAEAAAAGVPLAVNHNLRWMPTNRLVKDRIASGLFGELHTVHHVNRFNEDVKTWYTADPAYILMDHGIHYLDLVRWFVGQEPTAVSARIGRLPGSVADCALRYNISLRFARTALLVSLYFNNGVASPECYRYNWYLDGADGAADVGMETLELYDGTGRTGQYAPDGGWVPDGIYGAYAEFVDALTSGVEPPHSGRDHLRTLRVAAAAVTSAEADGDWVAVAGD